ncbi:hypothetical protein [Roseibium album]|uniref:hypothetical protein n=1 Tax=Roseibium album TaxID=311410 RepID=UPI003919EED9
MAFMIASSPEWKAKIKAAAANNEIAEKGDNDRTIVGDLKLDVMTHKEKQEHNFMFQVNQGQEEDPSGAFSMDFDEFHETVSDYFSFDKNAEVMTAIYKGYEEGTHDSFIYVPTPLDPIDLMDEDVEQMEALKSTLQQVIDQLDSDIPKYREWIQDQKMAREGMDIWPPVPKQKK